MIKTSANTRPTIDIMKEAGVRNGIPLLDGTIHKLRGCELSQLLALDLKSRLVKNTSDAVRQALIALREKLQAMDERTARLQAISEATQSNYEEE